MAYPIIDDLTGSFISVQGHLLPTDSEAAAAFMKPTESTMFYEFIRIVQGVPLFWEEHLARLSLSIAGIIELPGTLYADCRQLIAANGLMAANLRLVLFDDLVVIHLTPSNYPPAELFDRGVPTGILNWERLDPHVKIIRSDYKAAISSRFAEPGPFGRFYELLLADSQGFLTEGSRSNLFLIRDNQVLSAPESRILKGVTRKHVIEAINASGAELVEEMQTLPAIRAGSCEAAFLSSSPFDILPIRSIEEIELPSAENALLRRIDQAYRAIVASYVGQRLA